MEGGREWRGTEGNEDRPGRKKPQGHNGKHGDRKIIKIFFVTFKIIDCQTLKALRCNSGDKEEEG